MRVSRQSRIAGVALIATASMGLSACFGGDDSGGESGGSSDNKFVIAYNGDGDHQAWVDAVTQQISNNLGITAEGRSYPTFDELRTDITNREIDTAFRTGWQPDYPSIYNYLGPIFGTGAGSNDGDYSNEEFDELMEQISGAQDDEEAFELQAEAQAILMEDLPAIPLWYSDIAGVASTNVDNVEFNWKNRPELSQVTKDGGPVLAQGSQPQNPLIPTATNENGGGDILDQIFAGLVAYEPDGTSVNEVAESIESEDNVTWTVTIAEGQEYSDGSPVTAENFVKAWNYGADVDNAQLSSYFFYPIKGYDEAQESGADEMSGLQVVDDRTFTIELNQAEASFPDRLGYSAFFPLPDSAWNGDTITKDYGRKPLSNGPYTLEKWENDVEAVLVPNDNYNGSRPAQNEGITFKFYTDMDAAYTDVQAGNLDILEPVPASAFATFTDDDRVQSFNSPGSVFQSFTFAAEQPHFSDDEEGMLRRRAISKAIDREAVTEKIFDGTRTPAVDFSSPAMPGFTEDIEGNEVLEFDPEEAQELWEQANEINPW